MKIINDFLDKKDFDIIQNIMMGAAFIWNYSSLVDYEEDNDTFQFCHHFYGSGLLSSEYAEILTPIFEKLNAFQLQRVKANLLTRTPDIVENVFHVDIADLQALPEKLKQWTTSIFYINNNNGYTEFEDGTKVESVANRMITFPANIKHKGTSCTDEKTRVVINFNYFQL